MLSALAQRLSSALRKPHVLSHTTFISKVTAASQSRSFVLTLLAKGEHPEKPYHPPQMRKDDVWNVVTEYSRKSVAPRKSPEEIWHERSNKLQANPPPSVYAGRSVLVRSKNISKAIKMLSRRLHENKVRLTWKHQMRHEKKGVKRRRLKSQRWRRRFADEVRRKIELVRSIQRRGQ